MKVTEHRLFVAMGLMVASSLSWGGPLIDSIGEEKTVGTSGRHLHIATDAQDKPHIVADVGGSSLTYMYDGDPTGDSWQTSTHNSGLSHSSNPHIEINQSDQAWISIVNSWPGTMGIILRENMSTIPVIRRYSNRTGGSGGQPASNLSLDPATVDRCVAYEGNGGYYDKVLWNGSGFQSEGSGSLDTGAGGDKNYFWISRAGNIVHGGGWGSQAVWHSCSDWSYNNSVRKSNGKGALTWADPASYPWMNNEGCYPCVVGDSVDPQTAYLLSDYALFGGPGLALNVWRATNAQGDGAFAFSPTGGLLIVDTNGTSGASHYEPQLCPARNGGAWACYTVGYELHVRHIPATIQSASDLGPVTRFIGARGAICTDSEGHLHVAYQDGGVKYRKLEVSGINAIAPSGLTTDRTPTFEWAVPDGTTDVMLYYWPKEHPENVVSNAVTGLTTWTPTNDLASGYWGWGLAGTLNTEPISGREEFHISPPPPVLTSPLTWLDETSTMPTFVWQEANGSTWYHIRVTLNENAPPYGSQTVLDEWTQHLSWTTTVALAKGDYSWEVQGLMGGPAPLWGDWSDAGSFQIGVPGPSMMVGPTGTQIYVNVPPTFEWTRADSDTGDIFATWYQFFIVRDGRVINDTAALGSGWFTERPGQGSASLTLEPSGNWSTSAGQAALVPGEYGLWVRSVDSAHGSGPWTGSQLTVNRVMAPGAAGAEIGFGPTLDPVVDDLRPIFTWTATTGVPWYNLILVRNGGIFANQWMTTPTWQPAADLPYGQYRWWVAAYYTANSTYGPWLNPAAFQVGVPGNAMPLTPSGDTNATPTFTWSAADAATDYELYYQQIGNPTSGVSVPTGPAMTHAPAPLATGSYRWWVAASNQYGQVWNSTATDFVVQ